jgi:Flp pilus assembly protein TadG
MSRAAAGGELRRAPRSGVATVEFAIILIPLLILLFGIWEVGRTIQVQEILSAAARDGARIAAQGTIINLTGAYTEIRVSGSNPNLTNIVRLNLEQAGLDATGLEVTFVNVTDNSRAEPYQALKGDQVRVVVRIPYENVRLTTVPFFDVGLEYLTASADFYAVRDDPFQVEDSLPSWGGF